MTERDIGQDRALELTLERTKAMDPIELPLWEAAGSKLMKDIVAEVDSPSLTAATRDGFAVQSEEIEKASSDNPIKLRIIDTVVAGSKANHPIGKGECARVMTGAPMPPGSDAVIAVEHVEEQGEYVLFRRGRGRRRNIMEQGYDVTAGRLMACAGDVLTPAMTGFMAAGGIHSVPVRPRPKVAVVATGDEVVSPGAAKGLLPGQLYASNLVTLRSWLMHFGMESLAAVVPDEPTKMREVVESVLEEANVVLTSGGAWKSARDRSAEVIEQAGFEVVYHRVRLAPGKAIAFGVREHAKLGQQLAFCLPGGPPSNEMAFLQLTLPALLKMAGLDPTPFASTQARLTGPVRKQRIDPTWTNYFQAELSVADGHYEATPLDRGSRLRCQALAEGLIKLPAGVLELSPGDEVEVQVFDWSWQHLCR